MAVERSAPNYRGTTGQSLSGHRGRFGKRQVFSGSSRLGRSPQPGRYSGQFPLAGSDLAAGTGSLGEFGGGTFEGRQHRARRLRSSGAAAQEEALIAESRRLAAESSSALTKYPQRSLLLAVEAVKLERTLHGVRAARAEQSLLEALAVVGGRPVARAEGPITDVAISRDNRWLVIGSDDRTVRLCDLSAKDPAANPWVLHGHAGPICAVTISRDNRWLVTGSLDKTARLWDLSAQDPADNPVVLHGHDGPVWAVGISPDNRWLVTGSGDNTARLWDLSAPDPAADPVVLCGHDGPVYAVAISPNNRWLVTGNGDTTTRLWDLDAGHPAANPVVLRGHDGPVSAVGISPDNR